MTIDLKLDPEAKALWLEALRDPTRKQAQGLLNNGRGMCCLGVACDISGFGEWVSTESGKALGFKYSPVHYAEDKGLPTQVATWLGLPLGPAAHPENPRIPGLLVRDTFSALEGDDVISLAQLNDSGFTFAQIADVIEYFM